MDGAQARLAGAVLVGLAVALGAFGAHALRGRLGEGVERWRTAVQYQMVHGLGLVAVGMWPAPAPASARLAAVAFVLGTVLFSGSLYALSLGRVRWLGPVTPLGGLCLVAGWALLAFAAA
ncbi:MAG: DUF423 domain-containing protein [Firmicutes bacterium]|nr:DUF423 domain-containing protein [Bacillota bacterium]